MKIIRSILPPTPFVIADSNLTSSNVTETEYSAWEAGTNYGITSVVQIVSPSATILFKISPAANERTVEWANHGLPVNTPIRFTTTGTFPTGITAGTIYFIRDIIALTSFNISLKPGGAAIKLSGSQSGVHTAFCTRHDVYQSLQASNLGHYPADSPTWWIRADSTNRWRMFDSSVSSQTSNVTSIATVHATTGIVDAVALLNINAASIRITQTDDADGVVYDETISGVATSGINDAYAYCFDPIVRKTEVVFTNLKPYADSSIAITLTDTNNTVLCGACVLGKVLDIGGSNFGMSIGIDDYSVKQQDSFGNYTVQERAFRRWVSGDVWVDNEKVDGLVNVLAGYRATPVVYIGDESFGSSVAMGFYERFSTLVRHPTQSLLAIEIKGLI